MLLKEKHKHILLGMLMLPVCKKKKNGEFLDCSSLCTHKRNAYVGDCMGIVIISAFLSTSAAPRCKQDNHQSSGKLLLGEKAHPSGGG